MSFVNPDDDKLQEECGVFGILGHPDAAAFTALGLHALQHRGQEASGIVTYDGERFHSERHFGLVGDHFTDAATIDRLPGNAAIGHTLYSTSGETVLRNVQPLFAELGTGGIAICHNGNFTNARTLRNRIIANGAICQSTSDTEVVLHLVARSKEHNSANRFTDAIKQMEGAFALVAMTTTKLIGARDRLGIRPLVLGDLDGAPIFASETCALDIIGSAAGYKCRPFWGAYSISKAAVHALAQTYAAECENTDILVNIANPGPIRTAMRALAMPGEDPDTLAHPSEFAEALVMMGSPELTQNGLLFDFPTKEWTKLNEPSSI